MTTEWARWLCLAWLLLITSTGNAVTPKVAAGGAFTLALKNDGTVVAWGTDVVGELGSGRPLQSSFPVQASGLSGIRAVATGYAHTVALRDDGTVWTWGANNYGQLGDGTIADRNIAAPVPGLPPVSE